jgi:mono/diheme cytochrome c family protein
MIFFRLDELKEVVAMNQLKKAWAGKLLVPALAGILLAGSALAGEECKALLQNKCSSCHAANYICPKMDASAAGRHFMTPESVYWQWVMHTMVKQGAVLTDQESSTLVDCLSSHDAQAKTFCPQKK